MDIIDILIAKKKSFTGETEKLTRQANAAMAKANEVASIIDNAQEALSAAEEANARSAEAAEQFDETIENLDTAINNAVNNIAISVDVINNNTSAAKIKSTRFNKNGISQVYETVKNYTTTGSNEDGGMTQKAITTALTNQKTELENKIKNIKIPASSGNNSTTIEGEPGNLVIVSDDGTIIASDIKESDLVRTQIITGAYNNLETVGIEINYTDKTFKRLQGANGLTAGANFDKFNMFGGRKRCIVDAQGDIIQFITDSDNVELQNIMVYQPAFYYLRIPLTTVNTADGIKIVKEQIYLADKKYAGFKLHPAFYDANGKPVKYILLSAFEACGYHTAQSAYEINDAQTIDFTNDKLGSLINVKPISGLSQNLTANVANHMAENIGTGWSIMNLTHVALNQILMLVEFGAYNIQNAFDIGLTQISGTSSYNCASITGSTLSLNNVSGRASATTNTQGSSTNTYTNAGRCAISYRGVENPFGNIWQLVYGISINNRELTYNNKTVSFKIPSTEDWIATFGYDEDFDWAFLPIASDVKGNDTIPVGDYYYVNHNLSYSGCVIGGTCRAQSYAGPFCYGFDVDGSRQNYSVRIYHTPIANSTIENSNYTKWLNN